MEEDIRIRIGARLAEIRKNKGLFQSDVAERCGLRQAHVSRLETGQYDTRIDTIGKVCKALNLDIEFVERTDQQL